MLNPFWSVKKGPLRPAVRRCENQADSPLCSSQESPLRSAGNGWHLGWNGDAAAIAVISAVVGELDQTADVDICTVIDPAHSICSRKR